MTVLSTDRASRFDAVDLLENYSLEITAKDVVRLEDAAFKIPAGTPISITSLPNEDFTKRITAAVAVRRLGFVPVPHIAARFVKSRVRLEEFLDALRSEAQIDSAFVIAGDTAYPEGPYESALAVIQSDLLVKYGIRRVGFWLSGRASGYRPR